MDFSRSTAFDRRLCAWESRILSCRKHMQVVEAEKIEETFNSAIDSADHAICQL